jgi:glycerol 2-dehydrogenase (NADP+)
MGKVLRPDEHPNFIDAWKEMEKLLGTGNLN